MNADALLADLIAHPDDDAPRLVYADFLLERSAEQRDRDRGEFIQLSCELAKLDDAAAEVRAPKVRRAMELLGAWELQWVDSLLAPLPRRRTSLLSDVDWTWSRGFIERYRRAGFSNSNDFSAGEMEQITRRTPMRDVWVTLAGSLPTTTFLARPWLSSLRALSVEFKVLADSIEAFCTTRALHSLKHLSVRFNDQRQVHVLAKHAASFTKLESLELTFPDGALERDTLQVISELHFGPRLKHFGWNHESTPEQLFDLPFPLESLALLHHSAGQVSLRGLIAAPRAFPSLRKLQLRGSWSFAALAELLASRGSFKELRLHGATSEPGFLRLIERANLESLEVFALSRAVAFGDREVEAFAAATQLSRLRELELRGLQITNAGAKALLAAPHLQRLRKLSLRQNQRIGAAQFASVAGFEELESLDLRENSIPARGAAAERLRKRFGAAAHVAWDAPSVD
ncbi:MAG: TIGR02996 domain-containing protein [Archangium sp.]